MSQVTYFQRFSQKENWITNSTLLLLSRFQKFDAFKFQEFLRILIETTEITIGVRFNQQVKIKSSVADGVLEQQGFRVVIETKLYDNFRTAQLKQHAEIFKDYHGTAVLLALSRNNVNKKQSGEVVRELQKLNPDIKFATASYKGLSDTIRSVLSDTDFEMHEILQDYEALCQEGQLISLKEQTMLVATSGWSLKENLIYGIYYDPADRTHSLPFDYIGLYNEKSIKAVGKIVKQVACELRNGRLIISDGLNTLDKEEAKRIKDVIENTPYYNLATNTRFFIVDKFYETHASKKKGSVRGKQYLFLKDQFEDFQDGMSGQSLAKIMDGKQWD